MKSRRTASVSPLSDRKGFPNFALGEDATVSALMPSFSVSLVRSKDRPVTPMEPVMVAGSAKIRLAYAAR
jgi:hypothetical protein